MREFLIKLIDWIAAKINRMLSKIKRQEEVVNIEIDKESVKEKLQAVKKATEKYNHRKGRLVWNSKLRGTYIRAIHGKLA